MPAGTLLVFLIGFGCRIQEFWHRRRDVRFWQLDVDAALHLFAFSRVSDLATGHTILNTGMSVCSLYAP